MLNVNKHMSLMERKKMQWAQERAEMEGLCSPWGLPQPAFNIRYSQNRSRYASTLEIRNTCPQTAQQDLLPRRQRSPSLPPILKTQETGHDCENQHEMNYSNKNQQEKIQNLKYRYEDGEGETSGYASDSAPHSSPELWKNEQKKINDGSDARNDNQSFPAWQNSDRSGGDSTQYRKLVREEERPKWGDRGVAAGRLWEPQEPEARLPQMLMKGTPSWVERGLNMIDSGRSQILMIDQMSNHSSAIENAESKSEHNFNRGTYLLGQNVQIEPNIKAERECKRLKALELQAAIMQQLEERERKKRDEKEVRLKEEREEEERFKRQLNIERQRLTEERRALEEKQHREQKRAEALRQALEKAEQLAKTEKENKKIRKMRDNFDAMSINSENDPQYSRKESLSQQPNSFNESKLIQNIYIEQAFSPRRKIISDHENISHIVPMSTETNIIMSNPQSARYNQQTENYVTDQSLDISKRQESQRIYSDSSNSAFQNNPSINLMAENPVGLVQIPMTHEVMAPMHYAHGSTVQMAFLMPQHMNPIYPCLHQPISMQALFPTEGSCMHQNNLLQTQNDVGEKRENKVLTPSKYRNQNCKDAYTQTDIEYKTNYKQENMTQEGEEEIKEKSDISLNQNYDQNTSEEKLNSLSYKKDKRLDEKSKEMDIRPKWGVNKPPTQYKKQSEKDIFYPQKRKLRQRKRIQEKNYTSHSSDENMSPTPPRELCKNYPKLDRNRVSMSENYWRKKNMKQEKDINISNFTIETTEISPLECDQTGIVRIGENYTNKKKVYTETKNAFKRGITLSQKFMNDKYGNPKIWNNGDEKISQRKDVKDEQNTRFKEKSDQRQQYLDSVNRVKKEQSAYYCDGDINQPIVLDQLRSLRDSLKKQQQLWGKYDPTDRSPSPKNDVDLEME